MKNLLLLLLIISASSCAQQTKEQIIEKYVTNCSKKYNYNYQMAKYQKCLDDGIKVDSTIAYLWQQKAMPYFKARKYEIGMGFLDKAVELDKSEWLEYRGFIKCIFQKDYKGAITDFETCKELYGNSYVMDHTFEFYIGLSSLQLNNFEKAERLFQKNIDDLDKELGKEWLHPTVLFYLGIAKYEQDKFDEAITVFDTALSLYPEFSDAEYYKAICLIKQGKRDAAKPIFKSYSDHVSNGFSINEDNAVYEQYPYQLEKTKHSR